MSSDRPAHRPSRRPLIMRVAIKEMCRVGNAGDLPTVGALAEAADLTPAAIYYHFPSRADLLIALIDEIHPAVLDIFDRSRSPGATPAEWAERFFHHLADWVQSHPDEARFYFLIAPAVPVEQVADACTRTREEFFALVSEQVRAGRDDTVLDWIHSHTIRELIIAALEMSLEGRDTSPRRVPTLRKAAASLAGALLTPSR